MIIEERITISAKPEVIFAIYADVERWNTWDPDTKSSTLNGPFAVGSKGRLCPTRGREVPIVITSLVPGRSFTAQSKIPFFQMDFDHELTPGASGTEVVHRVTLSGPLSLLLSHLVGTQVREGLPRTLLSLKKLAESRGQVDCKHPSGSHVKPVSNTDPSKAAVDFAEEMRSLGFQLDFTLASLETEVDRLLHSERFRDHSNPDNWPYEARLEAYVGEVLCRHFDGKWTGFWSDDNPGANIYVSKIEFGEYVYAPSFFLAYRISNGEEEHGTFKQHLARVIPDIQRRSKRR